jgi:uncharacterized coiled-coil protein SlyX
MEMKLSFYRAFDGDLSQGIELEDCIRRLAGYIDSWREGHNQWREKVELRLQRLEAVVNIDKQTIDEVDTSVRQSWQSLDERLKKLEELCKGSAIGSGMSPTF